MHTHVLVAGGGLAGLAIADQLSQKGIDHILVEAQGRFGGRILTKTIAGGAFDFGPAWFWPGQPRMAALTKRFGLRVFEQFATGDLIYQDQSGAIQRGRGFASMQGSLRIDGGMGALIDALGKRLRSETTLTDTAVTALDLTGANPKATLSTNQTVDAQHVVLAIPPRVIADTIAITPTLLSDQRHMLETVPTWMAGQAKIVAIYDQPHWRNKGLSGDAMSHRGPMVEIHDASPFKGGPYALFGFVGVPAQMRMDHSDDMMRLALEQLVAMFGPEMATPVDILLQDWATLPTIARAQDQQGPQAHPAYGLPNALTDLSQRGLHFASTETSPGFGGFLEGALEAAERTLNDLTISAPNTI